MLAFLGITNCSGVKLHSTPYPSTRYTGCSPVLKHIVFGWGAELSVSEIIFNEDGQ